MKYKQKHLRGLATRLYREYITYCVLSASLNLKTVLKLCVEERFDQIDWTTTPIIRSMSQNIFIELQTLDLNSNSTPNKYLQVKNRRAIDNLTSVVSRMGMKMLKQTLREYENNIEVTVFNSDSTYLQAQKYIKIVRQAYSLSAIDADRYMLNDFSNCLFIDLEWHSKHGEVYTNNI